MRKLSFSSHSALPTPHSAHSWLLLLAAAFASCDLLSTRTPQQPAQQSSFRTPTSPDLVLQNVQNALNERDAASYTKCFSDSTHGASQYHFVPAADAQQYAARFLGWSVKDETSFFITLNAQVPKAASIGLYLDSLQTESASSDSTVYAAAYTLIAQHTAATIPTQVKGRMHLTIKSDPATQQWAITQWIDVANGADPSWSILKARFSQ